MSTLARIDSAVAALQDGRPVIAVDNEDRENEGDVILAAEHATAEWIAWTVRHSSGFLCAPMPDWWADRLELPLMVADNQDSFRTAYTVSVDAREGITTGISAADRATTARMLADPGATPDDFVRPGHMLPLRARSGGVLERPGHTEAAVDLCTLAGLAPVGIIGELVHDSGEMMRLPDLLELGVRFEVPVISIQALVEWLRARRVRQERAS